MARILTTLGVLCLFSSITSSSDLVGISPTDGPSPAPNGDGIDVEIFNESTPTTWQGRDQLLGDMGGFRTMLARHGMAFEISSLDEGFGTPTNTLDDNVGGRYHGLTDVTFSIDTEGAGWWRGGQFFFDLQNARGGDISDLVGDLQGISNIVAPPGTRFVEYFLDQTFADGRFRLKLGKQDANADFVVAEGGGEFINSSFGLIPTVPLPTFPAPALGVMGGWSPSKAIHLKAGYWDGAPELGSGISTAVIDGSKGTIAAFGIEITPFGDHHIGGTYRVGVWRHSEVEVFCPPDTKEIAQPLTGPAEGVYFTADQGIWETEGRRLSTFVQGGWGESDRSVVSRYFGGGLTMAGPLKGRPDDVAGIGIAYADIGQIERVNQNCSSETVVEIFYEIPLLGWMTLNPDLQWILRSGETNDTAFVTGLRVATTF